MKIQRTIKVHSFQNTTHRQKRSRSRLAWFAVLPLAVAIGQALANPDGGVVVGGQAAINQTPGVTTVDQSSDRAIINWRGFSIDPGELTRFNQPGKDAVALNRVLGKDPSKLLGQLKANGHVWLVNPNGILFGPSARVDVHGLLATTADIADQDFLAGRNTFSIPSPNADASVVNQGTISIGQHGLGGLVAPHVRNAGVIQGQLGQVVIAGAPTFTLDFYGDGLIQFEATSKVTENANPSDPLVRNDGKISVDGGDVLITANAAAGVVDEAINMDGIIQARSVGMENGAIVLKGGDEGIVHVAGELDASGHNPGETGGTVKVLGKKVGLYAGTKIDASGDTGGGKVLIGGNLQGKGPEPNAERTYVDADASISADAGDTGDGGRVIVWADDVTAYRGEISARGGLADGDGGFVEVSGKRGLRFTGQADVGASAGSDGTVLLDPTDINIVPSGGADNAEVDDGIVNFNDGDLLGDIIVFPEDFTIDEAALEALDGNILLQARRDITVEEGLVNGLELINQQLNQDNPDVDVEQATFQAGRDITVNSSIRTGGGHLSLEADSISSPIGGSDGEGTLTIAENVRISTGIDDVFDTSDGEPGERINITTGGNIQFEAADIVIDPTAIIDAGHRLDRLIPNDKVDPITGAVTRGWIFLTGGSASILGPTGGEAAQWDSTFLNNQEINTIQNANDVFLSSNVGFEIDEPIEISESNNINSIRFDAPNSIFRISQTMSIAGDVLISTSDFIMDPGSTITSDWVAIDGFTDFIGLGDAIPDEEQIGFNISNSELSSIDASDLYIYNVTGGGSVVVENVRLSEAGTRRFVSLSADTVVFRNTQSEFFDLWVDAFSEFNMEPGSTISSSSVYVSTSDFIMDPRSAIISDWVEIDGFTDFIGLGEAIPDEGQLGFDISNTELNSINSRFLGVYNRNGSVVVDNVPLSAAGPSREIRLFAGDVLFSGEAQSEFFELDVDAETINIDAPISVSENLSLTADVTALQTAPIAAQAVQLLGEGAFELRHVDNAVTILAADTSGTIEFVNSQGILISQVGRTEGISAVESSDVVLDITGDLIINAPIVAGDFVGLRASENLDTGEPGDIFVNATITAGFDTEDSGSFAAALVADRNILLNAGGDLTVAKTAELVADFNSDNTGVIDNPGNTTISLATDLFLVAADGIGITNPVQTVILEDSAGLFDILIVAGTGTGDIRITNTGVEGAQTGSVALVNDELAPFITDGSVAVRNSFGDIIVNTSVQGSEVSLTSSGLTDVNANVSSTNGAIDISSDDTVDTTGGDLGSNGGDVTILARGNIDTSNITTGFSQTLAGEILITSSEGAIDTTAGELNAADPGDAGAVRLEAARDITTSGIFASSLSGDGGDITLISNAGSIDTSLGQLNSISVVGDAGAIQAQASGNITTGDVFAGALNDGDDFFDTGSSGGINFNSLGGDITTGGLLSPSEAVFGSAGTSGDIVVTAANGSIRINGLVLAFSNAAVDGGSGDAGDGGAITLNAANDITVLSVELPEIPSIQSNSRSDAGSAGNGGPISIVSTAGSISVNGDINSTSIGSDASGSAGGVALTAPGTITIENVGASAGDLTAGAASGSGGAVTLTALGDISAGNISSASSAGQGGAIDLNSSGNIAAGSMTLGSIPGLTSDPLTVDALGTIEIVGLTPNTADISIGTRTRPDTLLLPNAIDTSGGNVTLFVGNEYTFTTTLTTEQGDFALDGLQDVTLTTPVQTNGGGISVQTGGTLTLEAPMATNIDQALILLVADGGFVNRVGESGLQPGNGRYLVYSNDPADDIRGIPDDKFNKRYSLTFDSEDPQGTDKGLPAEGNFFLYEITPTLSITAEDASRDFGEPNPAFTFTSTGLIDGDTLETALSDPVVLTSIAVETSPPDDYPIEVGPSDLSSPLGYAIESESGTLTISPSEAPPPLPEPPPPPEPPLRPELPSSAEPPAVGDRVVPVVPLVLTDHPDPTFTVPAVGSLTDSNDLLSPNDGNRELWGPPR